MEPLPPKLEYKRRSLALKLGRPVFVRGLRSPDTSFRGRLRVTPDRVLIEYHIPQAGYFWHIPIIEELLDRAGVDVMKRSTCRIHRMPTAELTELLTPRLRLDCERFTSMRGEPRVH